MAKQKALSVPNLLHQLKVPIENSAIPYAQIQLTDTAPSLFNSKLGGYPYMPLTSAYPKDEDGNNMLLLAQINLNEAQLQEPFPKEGLLQFFISPNLYEYYKENNAQCEQTSLFYVRYFPYLLAEDQIVQNFPAITFDVNPSFPIKKECSISFTNKYEPVSATDYRIYNYINQHTLEQIADEDGRTYEDIYLEHYLGATHKVGGYPYFIEHDIRLHSLPHRHYDTLLLQIVSDDDDNIMWGDSGTLKFFINKDALQQLDFSNIYLHVEDYS